jgi:hypothetical protein
MQQNQRHSWSNLPYFARARLAQADFTLTSSLLARRLLPTIWSGLGWGAGPESIARMRVREPYLVRRFAANND